MTIIYNHIYSIHMLLFDAIWCYLMLFVSILKALEISKTHLALVIFSTIPLQVCSLHSKQRCPSRDLLHVTTHLQISCQQMTEQPTPPIAWTLLCGHSQHMRPWDLFWPQTSHCVPLNRHPSTRLSEDDVQQQFEGYVQTCSFFSISTCKCTNPTKCQKWSGSSNVGT